MSLKIFTNSYGSPGDVENKVMSSPATLTEWIEKAKKAVAEEGGFVTCITKAPEGTTTTSKCLVAVDQVEWIYEVP
jgi:hypothetical protein